jgi:hypothetical protein
MCIMDRGPSHGLDQISLDAAPVAFMVADADVAAVSLVGALLGIDIDFCVLGSIGRPSAFHQAHPRIWCLRNIWPERGLHRG